MTASGANQAISQCRHALRSRNRSPASANPSRVTHRRTTTAPIAGIIATGSWTSGFTSDQPSTDRARKRYGQVPPNAMARKTTMPRTRCDMPLS